MYMNVYVYTYTYMWICSYRNAHIRACTYTGGSAVSAFRAQHSRGLPIFDYTDVILQTLQML